MSTKAYDRHEKVYMCWLFERLHEHIVIKCGEAPRPGFQLNVDRRCTMDGLCIKPNAKYIQEIRDLFGQDT